MSKAKVAVDSGSVDEVRQFLRKNAKCLNEYQIRPGGFPKFTILGYAVYKEEKDIVKFLAVQDRIQLVKGSWRPEEGAKTPLEIALDEDNEEIIEFLDSANAPIKRENYQKQVKIFRERKNAKKVEQESFIDVVVRLSEGKITPEEARNVQKCRECADENSIRSAFECGELPLGCCSHLIWKPLQDTLARIPEVMKPSQQQVEEHEKQIAIATARHEELEEKIQMMRQEQQQILHHKKQLEERVTAARKVLEIWRDFNQNEFPTLMTSIQRASDVEQKLTNALNAQMRTDPEKVAALSDKEAENSSKLSLVFNLFGLSPKTIRSLADVTGEEFLDAGFIMDFECYDELNFETQKDLAYCHEMFISGNYCPPEHQENCVVCMCGDSEKLWDLLKEHEEDINISSLSQEMLASHSINGPRALALRRRELVSKLNVDTKQAKETHKIIYYLRKLHAKHISCRNTSFE